MLDKNPIFHVCTNELELSDGVSNQEEFNEIMNNVFAADMHGFTIV